MIGKQRADFDREGTIRRGVGKSLVGRREFKWRPSPPNVASDSSKYDYFSRNLTLSAICNWRAEGASQGATLPSTFKVTAAS
jgi:hypothetical protein